MKGANPDISILRQVRVECAKLQSAAVEIRPYRSLRRLFALQPLRSKPLLRPDGSDPIGQRAVQGQVFHLRNKLGDLGFSQSALGLRLELRLLRPDLLLLFVDQRLLLLGRFDQQCR